jgi:hypothetical protein
MSNQIDTQKELIEKLRNFLFSKAQVQNQDNLLLIWKLDELIEELEGKIKNFDNSDTLEKLVDENEIQNNSKEEVETLESLNSKLEKAGKLREFLNKLLNHDAFKVFIEEKEKKIG